ncbi:hypothetical protein BH11BAC1_BH11BAC1_20140 [soil metagenome]
MKKYLFIVLAACLVQASYTSCKSTKDSTQNKPITYVCPMHPEVTSDKPGKCPKCGMDLVKKD